MERAKMKEQYIRFSHTAIFWLIAAAVAAMPLFFAPITSEFFEFNKLTLFTAATALGYLLWSVRMVLEKKFTFTRTPLDIPIFLLAAVYFIGSMASLDQVVSLFGSFGRPYPSFFSVAALAAFYFLTVANLKTRKQVETILMLLVGTTAAAALIAVASYFGIYFPFDFARFRSANTLGSPDALAILEALVIPVAILWAMSAKTNIARAGVSALAAVTIFSFVLIGSLPGFIAAALAAAFGGLILMRTKITKTAQTTLIVLAAAALLFGAVRFIPQLSARILGGLIQDKSQNVSPQELVKTPLEIKLPQSSGWDIAASTIGKRPFFGTGPATFQFAYTQLKPRVLNRTPLWPVRFDKSSSDFTEAVTTLGIAGAIIYLIVFLAALRFIWMLAAKGEAGSYFLAPALLVVSFIAGSLMTTSSLSSAVPFFFALAAIGVLAKARDEKIVAEMTIEVATLKNRLNWFPLGGNLGVIRTTVSPKDGSRSQLFPLIFILAVLVVVGFAARHAVNAYRAEYFYRQATMAVRAGDGNKTLDFLQKAIAANSSVDAYHRQLSQTALQIAINLNSQKDLTDDQKRLLTQLVSVAIDQAKIASGYQILPLRVPGISAANVANWEALADAYRVLIGSVEGTDTHAVNALAQAVNLDPENAALHDRLGLLYQRLNNLDLAQRKFEDATIVKGDFGPGHYHLAKILIEKKGDVARIAQELTLAKRFLPKDDPAIADIDKNLEEYNKKVQELQKQQPQAVSGQPPAPPPPAGEPSPSPSPEATPEATIKPSL